MILDGHAHVANTEYGNYQLLSEQYQEAGIDQGVIVPGGMMDPRMMTRYITGEAKPELLDPPNDLIEFLFKQYPNKLFGFYCINPHLGEKVLTDLTEAVKRGFRGLKLAQIIHQFSFNAKIILDLLQLCGELDIPVYTHSAFVASASTKKIGQLAKNFPRTKFILGHIGFGPCDMDAVEFAKDLDNFFLETSTANYLIIKEALLQAGSTKLIFGSEFPTSHPMANLANIYALKCNSNDLDNILYRNMASLIKII